MTPRRVGLWSPPTPTRKACTAVAPIESQRPSQQPSCCVFDKYTLLEFVFVCVYSFLLRNDERSLVATSRHSNPSTCCESWKSVGARARNSLESRFEARPCASPFPAHVSGQVLHSVLQLQPACTAVTRPNWNRVCFVCGRPSPSRRCHKSPRFCVQQRQPQALTLRCAINFCPIYCFQHR